MKVLDPQQYLEVEVSIEDAETDLGAHVVDHWPQVEEPDGFEEGGGTHHLRHQLLLDAVYFLNQWFLGLLLEHVRVLELELSTQHLRIDQGDKE